MEIYIIKKLNTKPISIKPNKNLKINDDKIFLLINLT